MIRPTSRRRKIAASSLVRGMIFRGAVAAWLLAAIALPASAQNRFWVTNVSGSFGSNSNWATSLGGASGASPPGVGDTANFTLGNTYTVNFSGNVTNTALLISGGNLTFDLNGSEYLATSISAVSIGTAAGQTGQLRVRDGLLAVDTAADTIGIATAIGATGALTVSTGGRVGNGTSDPNLVVGGFGSGTLTVEENGRLDVAAFSIGSNETASGTVTIGSPNAIVDASGAVTVGSSGTGALTLQNGGILSSAGTSTLGSFLGANGTVSLNGVGTSWTQAGSATIGDAGDAALAIQNGATVSTTGTVAIGNAATGFGSVQVNGIDAVWNLSTTLSVGVAGLGNLVITGGGRVNNTTGATNIANNAGGEGNVVVSGAGSRWSVGAVTVGNSGAGNLTIANGGVMNTAGNVTIASAATSVSKTLVNGAGSALNVTGALTVGNLGSGTLTVENGATVSATGALVLNDPAGAPVATLNFNGGTLSSNGFTRGGASVLNWTDGTYLVNGGSFNNGGANLTLNGGDLDDLPALRLSAGAQSTVANLPNLTIGSSRQGAAIVSGGSSFQTTTTSIGSQDGGSGALVVEGINSGFTTSGDLGVGGTTTAAGGLGTVTIGTGGTVTAGGTLRLWNGGTININGGTLAVTNLAASGGRVNINSGAVQVLSAFNANATALDALLGPTHALGLGRRIEVPGNTLNLQTDLSVVGGAISGNILSISSNVVADLQAGGSATFSNGITNPAGARMYVSNATVAAGTTFTNGGELHLAGITATVNATSLVNTGLVSGSGRINNVVTNNSTGQIRVAVGERLEILGGASNNVNNGLVDADGGSIEFGRSVTNSSTSPSSGLIAARDATLRFQGGLLNSGALTFTAGVSDVFGDITNQNNLATPGRIIVSGGAQANFYDDVVNSGMIQVSANGDLASTAIFLGSYSGAGVSGTGHVFMEGDVRPGFSPGTMAIGGDLSFGSFSTLEIELAGPTPGTQYDRVTVADTATLAGTLEVSLLGGFRPAAGSSFQILTAAGGRTGTFDSEVLPTIGGGLSWDMAYAAQSVTLSVGGVIGDYNLNGIVDGSDYTLWRDLLGTNTAAADGSGNGVVDQDDYNIWKANFGDVAPPGAGGGSGENSLSAVPEPSTCLLAGLLAIMLGFSHRIFVPRQ